MTTSAKSVNDDTQRRLMRLVSRHEPISRPDLSQRAELTPQGVGIQVRKLVKNGLLRQSVTPTSTPGRPAARVAVERSRNATIGITGSDRTLQIAASDFADNLMYRQQRSVPADIAPDAFVDTLSELIREALRAQPLAKVQVRQILLGIAALLDQPTGRLLGSAHFPKLQDVDLIGPLTERFGIPVETGHHGHVGYFGVLRPHAVGGEFHALLSWGVGVAWTQAYPDGMSFLNTFDGVRSVGHAKVAEAGRRCTCGRRGCLEAEVGLSGVRDRLAEADPRFAQASIGELVEAANAGQAEVVRILRDTAERLGREIAWLVHLGNVQHLWIDAHVGLDGDTLADALRRGLADRLHEDHLRQLGVEVLSDPDTTLVRGACRLAREVFLDPQLIARLRVRQELNVQAASPGPLRTGAALLTA